ncbi:hypothetical protein H0H81_009605 [Sphagnurus paluster]|uniref:F-box domain-containing protein n=1 Tax=Sphagnurus paluster TaxID=117069 RepID=A0A9P7K781_9AGAR|nr:hypothetical protein H0H81_009605 [Sphagnurus paluster]
MTSGVNLKLRSRFLDAAENASSGLSRFPDKSFAVFGMTLSNLINLIDVSCLSSYEDRQAAYTQISLAIDAAEVSIKELNNSILALKRRHNSLSLIARLPPELLGRIFVWNAEMQRGIAKMPWIKVSFVCSHWRSVSLRNPEMWTNITTLRSEDLTKLVLSRSAVIPLDVDFEIYDYKTLISVRAALQEIPRARNVELKAQNYIHLHEVVFNLDDSFPPPIKPPNLILERLKISSPYEEDVLLSAHIFSYQAPQLRTLELEGIRISPKNFLLLSGLTTLYLKLGHQNPDISAPHLSEVFFIIEASPNIENLALENMHGQSDDLDPQRIAHLPRLQHISLHYYDFLSIEHILLHLSYPLNVTHDIRFDPFRGGYVWEQSVRVPSLKRFGTLLSSRTMPVVKLEVRHGKSGPDGLVESFFSELEYCIESWPQPDDPRSKFPQICIRIGDRFVAQDGDDRIQDNMLPVLCSTMQIYASLQSLYVVDIPLPMESWLEFGAIETLGMIDVTENNPGLVGALNSCLRDIHDTSNRKFRSLHTLVTRNWNFSADLPFNSLGMGFDEFMACIKACRKSGVPLGNLQVL